jgi:hypothetical protein
MGRLTQSTFDRVSLGPLLGALALKLVIVEDAKMLSRVTRWIIAASELRQ